jgi:titin
MSTPWRARTVTVAATIVGLLASTLLLAVPAKAAPGWSSTGTSSAPFNLGAFNALTPKTVALPITPANDMTKCNVTFSKDSTGGWGANGFDSIVYNQFSMSWLSGVTNFGDSTLTSSFTFDSAGINTAGIDISAISSLTPKPKAGDGREYRTSVKYTVSSKPGQTCTTTGTSSSLFVRFTVDRGMKTPAAVTVGTPVINTSVPVSWTALTAANVTAGNMVWGTTGTNSKYTAAIYAAQTGGTALKSATVTAQSTGSVSITGISSLVLGTTYWVGVTAQACAVSSCTSGMASSTGPAYTATYASTESARVSFVYAGVPSNNPASTAVNSQPPAGQSNGGLSIQKVTWSQPSNTNGSPISRVVVTRQSSNNNSSWASAATVCDFTAVNSSGWWSSPSDPSPFCYVTGLASNTYYRYQVQVWNAAGTPVNPPTYSAGVLTGQPPTAPAMTLVYNKATGVATMTWFSQVDTALMDYQTYRVTQSRQTSPAEVDVAGCSSIPVPASATTLTCTVNIVSPPTSPALTSDTTPSAGEIYYFRLYVITDMGTSPLPTPSTVSFGSLGNVVGVTPRTQFNESSSHWGLFEWDIPSSDGNLPITGYRVELTQATASGPTWGTPVVTDYPIGCAGTFATSNYQVMSASASTRCAESNGISLNVGPTTGWIAARVRVAPINWRGVGAYTGYATITEPTPPSNPTGMSLGAQNALGSFPVTWSHTGANLAAGSTFEVTALVFNANGIASPVVTSCPTVSWVSGTTNYSCNLTGLTTGVTYKAFVVARNAFGETGPNFTNERTLAGVPTAPVSPTVSLVSGTRTLRVAWTAPASNGGSAITGYTVTASPGGATCAAAANATSCDFTSGLTLTNSYTFSVVATNTWGSGASASTDSIQVDPTPPLSLVATTGYNALTVAFAPPASAGIAPITGYTLYADYLVNGTPTRAHANSRTCALTSIPDPLQCVFGTMPGGSFRVTAVANDTATTPNRTSAESSPISVTITATTVPGPPTSVQATAGNRSVTVQWTAPTDTGGTPITGYTVRAYTGSTSGSSVASCSTTGATTCTVGGLTNGQAYTFTAIATNAQGNSVPSADSNSATPYTVPTAPSLVDAAPADRTLVLTFSPPTDTGGVALSGYEYRYSTDGGTTISAWSSASVTGTRFSITGLTNGTSTQVWLRAVNSAGPSASSAPISGTPSGPPTSPNVTITPGDSQLALAWPAITDGAAITRYEVSKDGGTTWSSVGTSLSTTLTGLVNGQGYPIAVRGISAVGAGAYSTQTGTPRGVPAAPALTNSTATAGDASNPATLAVSFTIDDRGSAITSVQYRLRPNNTACTISWVDSGSWGSWTDMASAASPLSLTSLTYGTCYEVEIRGINAAGTGAASRISGRPLAAPSAPLNLAATAGDTTGVITFTPPADNGGSAISAYEYKIDSGAWTSTGGASATPLTLTGLTNGTAYSVSIRAVNTTGAGAAASVSLSPVRTLQPPAAPIFSNGTSGVDTFVAGDNSGTLAIVEPSSAPSGEAITGYAYSTDRGFSWSSLAGTLSSLIRTFTISGLTNGLPTQLLLKALNAVGESPISETEVTAVSRPDIPQDLAVAVGDHRLTLTWSAPSNDGGSPITRYVVTRSPGTGCTVAPPAALTCTFTGLTNGTQYDFTVTPENAIGTGPYAIASGTPESPPPAQVSTDSTPSQPVPDSRDDLDPYVPDLIAVIADGASGALHHVQGASTTTYLAADEDGSYVRLAAEGLSSVWSARDSRRNFVTNDSRRSLQAVMGGSVEFSASGLRPNEQVKLYRVARGGTDQPELIGTFTVNERGQVEGVVSVDLLGSASEAALQLVGRDASNTVQRLTARVQIAQAGKAPVHRRIYFAARSSKLSKAGRKAVSSVIAEMNAREGESVRIISATPLSGRTSQVNAAIAGKRAKAVMRALRTSLESPPVLAVGPSKTPRFKGKFAVVTIR